jgi:hypothetical protein
MKSVILLFVAVSLASVDIHGADSPAKAAEGPGIGLEQQTAIIDFIDPTYGSHLRHISNPVGDEHCIYHYRSVFNADNSRLLAIETPAGSTDYFVSLYDGEGTFLNRLFRQAEYDWKAVWDRSNPRYFYTRKDSTVYRFDIESGQATSLKTFDHPAITTGPAGLSLNQTGDRLLLRMSDNTVRTYRLPALDDERICLIEIPTDRYANWDKLRFTGYKDYFALEFAQKQPLPEGARSEQPFTRIYDGATGQPFSTLVGVPIGHHDFSPDGKIAYVDGFNQHRDMQVHVVNLDGTEDHIVFSASRENLRYVRNFHITWPAGVRDWFTLSFFPQTGALPDHYEPWLDELVQVFVDGKHRVLARTGTTCNVNFWSQPQQSVSWDGTRVLFNSNGTCTVGEIGQRSSGTIDLCILSRKERQEKDKASHGIHTPLKRLP